MARIDLRLVDEESVIADYEAGVRVSSICQAHDVSLTRLYSILDDHGIARRRPNAPRLPQRLRQRILTAYRDGADVTEIARLYGVSTSTVSKLAIRHGLVRVHHRTRDELIDLVVRWLLGETLTEDDRDAVRRVGCRTTEPGLRTLTHLEPDIRSEVAARLAAELTSRWIEGAAPAAVAE
ncbi:MAG: helix-turn-helix domain-containing protein [Acidimicrobiales bacterium]